MSGGDVRLLDYPDGFTTLVNAVGTPSAVRFQANNIIVRTERAAPFSIGGDSDDEFNRCNPQLEKQLRFEALADRHLAKIIQ